MTEPRRISLRSYTIVAGSHCKFCRAAVMLCWSRRRSSRTTLAAARWTISSLCSNNPLIPHRAACHPHIRDVEYHALRKLPTNQHSIQRRGGAQHAALGNSLSLSCVVLCQIVRSSIKSSLHRLADLLCRTRVNQKIH